MDSFPLPEEMVKPVDIFPARIAGKEQHSSCWQAMPRKDALLRDHDFVPWSGGYQDGQWVSRLPWPKRDVSLLLGAIKAGGSGSFKEAPSFREKDSIVGRS